MGKAGVDAPKVGWSRCEGLILFVGQKFELFPH